MPLEIPAGRRLTAELATRLQNQDYFARVTSTPISTLASVVLTDSIIDITTRGVNAVWTAVVGIEFDTATVGTTPYIIRGGLQIDGVAQAGQIRWSEGSSGSDTSDFANGIQVYSGVIASPGTYQFALYGNLSSVTGGPVINFSGNSSYTVTVREDPLAP